MKMLREIENARERYSSVILVRGSTLEEEFSMESLASQSFSGCAIKIRLFMNLGRG